MKRLLVLVMVASLLAGCVSDPVSFRKCDPNAAVLGQAEGSDVGIMLFQVIPIKQNARFNNAYQEAVAKLGGTCLVDPVIEEQWFWAWLLNGYIFRVKGTVVKEGK